ncbi:protein of unknown function [Pseudomonas mediterranea]
MPLSASNDQVVQPLQTTDPGLALTDKHSMARRTEQLITRAKAVLVASLCPWQDLVSDNQIWLPTLLSRNHPKLTTFNSPASPPRPIIRPSSANWLQHAYRNPSTENPEPSQQ